MFANARIFLGAALFSAALGTTAHAEGFIAGGLRDLGIINEETRQQLDGINHQLGNPVDHAITRGMDYVVPGSGTAVETYWQGQRMINNMQNNQGGGLSPIPVQGQSGQNFQMQQVQQQFGQYCNVGGALYGPGPALPRGAACWVGSPMGPVWGIIN